YFVRCNYRPFDTKWTYYTGEAKGFLGWPVQKIMQHFLKGKNVGLVFRRQQPESRDLYIFCSNGIIADGYIRSDNKGGESLAPLYLYLEGDIVDGIRMPYKKTPNLNESIINEISQRISLQFTEEKGEAENTFAPIDVLDYIYAILHSPAYRERYKEFLKIDFPRVPYPENTEQFWKLALLGGKLRRLHLLEGVEPQQGMADYPIAGSNEVTKPEYVDSKVYINDSQFFENIPLVAWNFYIGGYQPAQKWLKDRKGRTLNYDDIEHYRKIIWVLKETEEVMKKIDKK
ncbi:MAG: DNA methyltransferase, partial [Candidatus Azobacteroides sp.]|nr:DNA methyltransferase [Candidatus Azobacteroides sp.]